MTPDLSALREEVARALPLMSCSCDECLDGVLAAFFRDLSRLVRVLTDQPCATCEGAGRVDLPSPRVKVGSTWATQTIAVSGNCPSCNGTKRLDVVGLLVEAGILAANARLVCTKCGFQGTDRAEHVNCGYGLIDIPESFRRSSKYGKT